MLRYTPSSRSRPPKGDCLCLACRRRRWWEVADLPIFVVILMGAFTGRYDCWLAWLFLVGYAVFRAYHLKSGHHKP